MTDPAAAPQQVRTATLLYTIHGALRIVEALIALVLLPATIAYVQRVAALQVQRQGQQANGDAVTSIATTAAVIGTVLGVLIGVAIGVLTIVFARGLLRGRNWARIVLLVFAVLALPGLFSFGGVGGVGYGLLALVSTLAAVVAAVLTLLPAARPWFRRTLLPPA